MWSWTPNSSIQFPEENIKTLSKIPDKIPLRLAYLLKSEEKANILAVYYL